MNNQQEAEAMLDRLTVAARYAIGGEKLDRQERFWHESNLRLRPLHDRLVGLGWAVEASTHGSVYYQKGPERLRLSNHEVPSTPEREQSKWTWARHGWQIVTACKSLEDCHKEIDEITEATGDDDSP